MPGNAFSQEGVSIGRDPSDTSAVTTAQITGVIPELKLSVSVPTGIYVPVGDLNGHCRSEDNAPMKGGIYVKGDLDSFTMSRVGANKALYTLVQGATTTTVEIDRAAGGGVGTTKVTSNGWLTPPSGGGCPGVGAGPATRTFRGVPKGWQVAGNANATMVYVNGAINSISGTLQKDEQTNVTAAGTITITNNILYQNPPNPDDPTSNPTNLLGLFSAGGDVQIGDAAPNDVQIQAVEMAGTRDSAFLSSVHVQNWGTRAPSGRVHLLGGTVGKYYGIHGVMNGSGDIIQGFGKDFRFDTRFRRGYAPPYFPTTGLFVINEGTQRLTNVRPVWREGTPL